MPRLNLKKAHQDILIDLYTRTQRTVDDLPYTDEFEELYTLLLARA